MEGRENNEKLNLEHFPVNERLHSDVLEEKYGEIKVDIVQHNDFLREAHLIDKEGISRTYALTFFDKFENDDFKKINKEIKNSSLIGKTFRKYGYSIRKNVVDVYVEKISKDLMEKFQVNEEFAKVRLSEFYAKRKGEDASIYGIVAEIYSPDFRPAIINQYDDSQVSALSEFLNEKNIDKNEIWRRIGLDNDYHDLWNEMKDAKSKSLLKIHKLKEKIRSIIYKEN